jgi:tetratricopeptide (TPR) repeat protein
MSTERSAANDFSGDARAVVQAAAVHGGVHVHGNGHRFPPPRQLPLDPPNFFNREADIAALDRLIADQRLPSDATRSAVVVSAIAGAPGVGKTALALHWAHRVRHRFPDGDLFIDMQGYGPGTPLSSAHALSTFLRALDMPSSGIPETLDEQAALFRSLLDGKRMLVFIDNAFSSAQVRPLLPASRRCFAVITSRSALPSLVTREGAVRVSVDMLSPDESVELLSELIGSERIDAERDKASQVAELCGHLPLALRIVAERAARRPEFSLSELVEELVGEQHRLDALASADDELSDTRTVFSWSYRALTPELRRVFRLLSSHVGPDISLEAAAALIGAPLSPTKRHLRALADAHLLQEMSTNRFRLHDLLRSYSAERTVAEDSQQERTDAVRRVLSWYLLTADRGRRAVLPHSPTAPLLPAGRIESIVDFTDGPSAIRWFDTERLNLLAALRQAVELGQLDIAWKLPMAAGGFFELRSHGVEWAEIHELGVAAARALGDAFGEGANLVVLADAAWQLGQYEQAVNHYHRAASIGHELEVRWLEGFALRGLGLVREEQGDIEAAATHFAAALDVFRAAGNKRGEGMSLLSLGKCARARGQLTSAVEAGREAVAIFERIEDTWTIAWGQLALAASLAELDELAEAITALEQAATVFRDFEDQLSEASALALLGDLHARSGDRTTASQSWLRAAELYEALGDDKAADLRARIDRSTT